MSRFSTLSFVALVTALLVAGSAAAILPLPSPVFTGTGPAQTWTADGAGNTCTGSDDVTVQVNKVTGAGSFAAAGDCTVPSQAYAPGECVESTPDIWECIHSDPSGPLWHGFKIRTTDGAFIFKLRDDASSPSQRVTIKGTLTVTGA